MTYDADMGHQEGDTAPAAARLSWQRWLVGTFAGTVAYLLTHRAIEAVLGPAGRIGNTGLYAAIAIGLAAGTVVAGLTVKARTARRWIAALLLTLLAVAAIGIIAISPWILRPPE